MGAGAPGGGAPFTASIQGSVYIAVPYRRTSPRPGHIPPAIATQLVPGRERNDCALCVLAMYLGVSYEDVLREVAIRDRPYQGRQGLRLREVERIAKALGTPIRRQRKYDLSTAYGMLSLPNHLVLLRGGMIVDPEPGGASLWEVDDYLHAYNLRPGILLVAQDEA